MLNLDTSIFLALNGLAGQSAAADKIFIFLAEYLPYLIALAALALFVLWKESWARKWQLLLAIAISLAAAYTLIYFVLYSLWPRLRPFETLSGISPLVAESGLSFPSKHALVFFLLATIVYSIKRRAGCWFFLAAILISLGRVLIGVHYPLDILAGASLGVLAGWGGVAAAKKLKFLETERPNP